MVPPPEFGLPLLLLEDDELLEEDDELDEEELLDELELLLELVEPPLLRLHK